MLTMRGVSARYAGSVCCAALKWSDCTCAAPASPSRKASTSTYSVGSSTLLDQSNHRQPGSALVALVNSAARAGHRSASSGRIRNFAAMKIIEVLCNGWPMSPAQIPRAAKEHRNHHDFGAARQRRAARLPRHLLAPRIGLGHTWNAAWEWAERHWGGLFVSGWFHAQVVHTGRLPLFCFFVAFVAGFAAIRVSVRLIRARVRWWPGNLVAGAVHVHHMVFGVVLMAAGGIAGLAAPPFSLAWRAGAAAVFGLGTALVLDEFALILHLRDVYWANEGRLSVDAVFAAAGITALLVIGVNPIGVKNVANYHHMPGSPAAQATFVATTAVLFVLAVITLLKGKPWTALLGVVLPVALIVGAARLARPGSPWARWRYRERPGKLATAAHREERLRKPVIRLKDRVQDLLTGSH